MVRAIINLVILIVILVFGYWLFASFVTAPNAPYWAEINSKMPDALRRFSCEQVRKREATAPIQSCEGY
ncbi:MAG: hypothetical protein ACLPPF_06180 [Rhodomicrobium sp.]